MEILHGRHIFFFLRPKLYSYLCLQMISQKRSTRCHYRLGIIVKSCQSSLWVTEWTYPFAEQCVKYAWVQFACMYNPILPTAVWERLWDFNLMVICYFAFTTPSRDSDIDMTIWNDFTCEISLKKPVLYSEAPNFFKLCKATDSISIGTALWHSMKQSVALNLPTLSTSPLIRIIIG